MTTNKTVEKHNSRYMRMQNKEEEQESGCSEAPSYAERHSGGISENEDSVCSSESIDKLASIPVEKFVDPAGEVQNTEIHDKNELKFKPVGIKFHQKPDSKALALSWRDNNDQSYHTKVLSEVGVDDVQQYLYSEYDLLSGTEDETECTYEKLRKRQERLAAALEDSDSTESEDGQISVFSIRKKSGIPNSERLSKKNRKQLRAKYRTSIDGYKKVISESNARLRKARETRRVCEDRLKRHSVIHSSVGEGDLSSESYTESEKNLDENLQSSNRVIQESNTNESDSQTEMTDAQLQPWYDIVNAAFNSALEHCNIQPLQSRNDAKPQLSRNSDSRCISDSYYSGESVDEQTASSDSADQIPQQCNCGCPSGNPETPLSTMANDQEAAFYRICEAAFVSAVSYCNLQSKNKTPSVASVPTSQYSSGCPIDSGEDSSADEGSSVRSSISNAESGKERTTTDMESYSSSSSFINESDSIYTSEDQTQEEESGTDSSNETIDRQHGHRENRFCTCAVVRDKQPDLRHAWCVDVPVQTEQPRNFRGDGTNHFPVAGRQKSAAVNRSTQTKTKSLKVSSCQTSSFNNSVNKHSQTRPALLVEVSCQTSKTKSKSRGSQTTKVVPVSRATQTDDMVMKRDNRSRGLPENKSLPKFLQLLSTGIAQSLQKVQTTFETSLTSVATTLKNSMKTPTSEVDRRDIEILGQAIRHLQLMQKSFESSQNSVLSTLQHMSQVVVSPKTDESDVVHSLQNIQKSFEVLSKEIVSASTAQPVTIQNLQKSMEISLTEAIAAQTKAMQESVTSLTHDMQSATSKPEVSEFFRTIKDIQKSSESTLKEIITVLHQTPNTASSKADEPDFLQLMRDMQKSHESSLKDVTETVTATVQTIVTSKASSKADDMCIVQSLKDMQQSYAANVKELFTAFLESQQKVQPDLLQSIQNMQNSIESNIGSVTATITQIIADSKASSKADDLCIVQSLKDMQQLNATNVKELFTSFLTALQEMPLNANSMVELTKLLSCIEVQMRSVIEEQKKCTSLSEDGIQANLHAEAYKSFECMLESFESHMKTILQQARDSPAAAKEAAATEAYNSIERMLKSFEWNMKTILQQARDSTAAAKDAATAVASHNAFSDTTLQRSLASIPVEFRPENKQPKVVVYVMENSKQKTIPNTLQQEIFDIGNSDGSSSSVLMDSEKQPHGNNAKSDGDGKFVLKVGSDDSSKLEIEQRDEKYNSSASQIVRQPGIENQEITETKSAEVLSAKDKGDTTRLGTNNSCNKISLRSVQTNKEVSSESTNNKELQSENDLHSAREDENVNPKHCGKQNKEVKQNRDAKIEIHLSSQKTTFPFESSKFHVNTETNGKIVQRRKLKNKSSRALRNASSRNSPKSTTMEYSTSDSDCNEGATRNRKYTERPFKSRRCAKKKYQKNSVQINGTTGNGEVHGQQGKVVCRQNKNKNEEVATYKVINGDFLLPGNVANEEDKDDWDSESTTSSRDDIVNECLSSDESSDTESDADSEKPQSRIRKGKHKRRMHFQIPKITRSRFAKHGKTTLSFGQRALKHLKSGTLESKLDTQKSPANMEDDKNSTPATTKVKKGKRFSLPLGLKKKKKTKHARMSDVEKDSRTRCKERRKRSKKNKSPITTDGESSSFEQSHKERQLHTSKNDRAEGAGVPKQSIFSKMKTIKESVNGKFRKEKGNKSREKSSSKIKLQRSKKDERDSIVKKSEQEKSSLFTNSKFKFEFMSFRKSKSKKSKEDKKASKKKSKKEEKSKNKKTEERENVGGKNQKDRNIEKEVKKSKDVAKVEMSMGKLTKEAEKIAEDEKIAENEQTSKSLHSCPSSTSKIEDQITADDRKKESSANTPLQGELNQQMANEIASPVARKNTDTCVPKDVLTDADRDAATDAVQSSERGRKVVGKISADDLASLHGSSNGVPQNINKRAVGELENRELTVATHEKKKSNTEQLCKKGVVDRHLASVEKNDIKKLEPIKSGSADTYAKESPTPTMGVCTQSNLNVTLQNCDYNDSKQTPKNGNVADLIPSRGYSDWDTDSSMERFLGNYPSKKPETKQPSLGNYPSKKPETKQPSDWDSDSKYGDEDEINLEKNKTSAPTEAESETTPANNLMATSAAKSDIIPPDWDSDSQTVLEEYVRMVQKQQRNSESTEALKGDNKTSAATAMKLKNKPAGDSDSEYQLLLEKHLRMIKEERESLAEVKNQKTLKERNVTNAPTTAAKSKIIISDWDSDTSSEEYVRTREDSKLDGGLKTLKRNCKTGVTEPCDLDRQIEEALRVYCPKEPISSNKGEQDKKGFTTSNNAPGVPAKLIPGTRDLDRELEEALMVYCPSSSTFGNGAKQIKETKDLDRELEEALMVYCPNLSTSGNGAKQIEETKDLDQDLEEALMVYCPNSSTSGNGAKQIKETKDLDRELEEALMVYCPNLSTSGNGAKQIKETKDLDRELEEALMVYCPNLSTSGNGAKQSEETKDLDRELEEALMVYCPNLSTSGNGAKQIKETKDLDQDLEEALMVYCPNSSTSGNGAKQIKETKDLDRELEEALMVYCPNLSTSGNGAKQSEETKDLDRELEEALMVYCPNLSTSGNEAKQIKETKDLDRELEEALMVYCPNLSTSGNEAKQIKETKDLDRELEEALMVYCPNLPTSGNGSKQIKETKDLDRELEEALMVYCPKAPTSGNETEQVNKGFTISGNAPGMTKKLIPGTKDLDRELEEALMVYCPKVPASGKEAEQVKTSYTTLSNAHGTTTNLILEANDLDRELEEALKVYCPKAPTSGNETGQVKNGSATTNNAHGTTTKLKSESNGSLSSLDALLDKCENLTEKRCHVDRIDEELKYSKEKPDRKSIIDNQGDIPLSELMARFRSAYEKKMKQQQQQQQQHAESEFTIPGFSSDGAESQTTTEANTTGESGDWLDDISCTPQKNKGTKVRYSVSQHVFVPPSQTTGSEVESKPIVEDNQALINTNFDSACKANSIPTTQVNTNVASNLPANPNICTAPVPRLDKFIIGPIDKAKQKQGTGTSTTVPAHRNPYVLSNASYPRDNTPRPPTYQDFIGKTISLEKRKTVEKMKYVYDEIKKARKAQKLAKRNKKSAKIFKKELQLNYGGVEFGPPLYTVMEPTKTTIDTRSEDSLDPSDYEFENIYKQDEGKKSEATNHEITSYTQSTKSVKVSNGKKKPIFFQTYEIPEILKTSDFFVPGDRLTRLEGNHASYSLLCITFPSLFDDADIVVEDVVPFEIRHDLENVNQYQIYRKLKLLDNVQRKLVRSGVQSVFLWEHAKINKLWNLINEYKEQKKEKLSRVGKVFNRSSRASLCYKRAKSYLKHLEKLNVELQATQLRWSDAFATLNWNSGLI